MSSLGGTSIPVIPIGVALTALAALVSWGVAVYAWRRRPAPGASALSALTAATGWWALGYVVELLVADPGTKLLVAQAEWAGVIAAPVAWMLFAFSYTGRDRYTTPPSVIAISLLPMVAFVAVWTNPAHHLMWTTTSVVPTGSESVTLLRHDWGPLYWVLLGYGYLLWLAGATLVVRTAIDMPNIYRLQAVTLVVGALLPVVGNFATTLLELYGTAFDMTPAAFVGAGLACTVAMSQYDLLESRPVPIWVARDRVVEKLADAMLVTDTKWRVTDLNEEAVALLGGSRRSLKGRTVSDLVPGFSPPASADAYDETTTVTLSADGGFRHFELRASDFTDYHGRTIGKAVVLRDVTDRQRYLQQLEVMNRVLRHNLRTEANLLHGYADLVAESLDAGATDSARDHAATVQNHAVTLVNIGEKARKFAELMDPEQERSGEDDRRALDQLRSAVNGVRSEFPGANVTLAVLPPDDVVCSPALESVLRELLENGVKHDPGDDPTVVVRATVEDECLVVRVEDDGPGIHPDELAAIRADSETPLQHGSGLGLWLVTWGVKQAGGDVAFDRPASGGTTVRFRIPARRTDRRESGGDGADAADGDARAE